MCEECTLSLIPNVAKAVKTASVIHPNQDMSHVMRCAERHWSASHRFRHLVIAGILLSVSPFFRLP